MIVWALLTGALLIIVTIPPQIFGLAVGWCVGAWIKRRDRRRGRR